MNSSPSTLLEFPSQSRNTTRYSENWNPEISADDVSDALRNPAGIKAFLDTVKPLCENYTQAQMLALGEPWPPQRGWLARVKSKGLSQRQVEKLLAVSPRKKAAEYLTKKETAELLRLSLGTIHNLIKAKAFKVVRLGRLVRIPRKEIEEFMKQRTVNSKK